MNAPSATVDDLVQMIEHRDWLVQELCEVQLRINQLRRELGGAATRPGPTSAPPTADSSASKRPPPPPRAAPTRSPVMTVSADDQPIVDWLSQVLRGRKLTSPEMKQEVRRAGMNWEQVDRIVRKLKLRSGHSRGTRYGPWSGSVESSKEVSSDAK